jgi:uncharacterized protein (DUF433 family)
MKIHYFFLKKMKQKQKLTLHSGIYTLPDAALILNLPLSRLRQWVVPSKMNSDGLLYSWGEGRSRVFDFYELIEAVIIYNLRKVGVSMQKIKLARSTLEKILKCNYPFAKKIIRTDGSCILFDSRQIGEENILNISSHQIQSEFRDIVIPFCKKIDFDSETDLAQKYWPLGKGKSILVDPCHGFGRPVIKGTNITCEALYGMYQGGEKIEEIAHQYDVPKEAVLDAVEFLGKAA